MRQRAEAANHGLSKARTARFSRGAGARLGAAQRNQGLVVHPRCGLLAGVLPQRHPPHVALAGQDHAGRGGEAAARALVYAPPALLNEGGAQGAVGGWGGNAGQGTPA